ncbi:MAG: hypothetical protein OXD39_08040 [Gemmatimonadetes bacterium]|nr:hypothetical protein [Gemmatimonadota bacterium]
MERCHRGLKGVRRGGANAGPVRAVGEWAEGRAGQWVEGRAAERCHRGLKGVQDSRLEVVPLGDSGVA